MAARRLEHELAALEDMQLPELRKKWTSLSNAPMPRVSAGLLRYAIAYELQVAAHGGQPRKISQKLDQLAGGCCQSDAKPSPLRAARPSL